MNESFNIHEAKTHFSKLVQRAHDGEEIVVSKAGKPYAKLVPLMPKKSRCPGMLKGSIGDEFFEPLPEEELISWNS